MSRALLFALGRSRLDRTEHPQRRFEVGGGEGGEDFATQFEQVVIDLTDDLAARPYEILDPRDLDELISLLEPLAELLVDSA